MDLADAIKRERLSDELRAIQMSNVAKRPDETYEEHLARRAQLRMRVEEIWSELAW